MSRDPSQQIVITGTTPLFLIFVLPITLFHTAGWTRISVGLPTFPKVVRVNQRSESSIGSAGKYRGGWIKQHGKNSIDLLGEYAYRHYPAEAHLEQDSCSPRDHQRFGRTRE